MNISSLSRPWWMIRLSGAVQCVIYNTKAAFYRAENTRYHLVCLNPSHFTHGFVSISDQTPNFRDISSILIGAYNRTFQCMEANYPYAIKNQRGARNTPSRGYFCDELVLYGIRELA